LMSRCTNPILWRSWIPRATWSWKKCKINLLRMHVGEHRGVKHGCLALGLETLEHRINCQWSTNWRERDIRIPCLSQSDKTTTKAGSLWTWTGRSVRQDRRKETFRCSEGGGTMELLTRQREDDSMQG
jgi:hypothetical protein